MDESSHTDHTATTGPHTKRRTVLQAAGGALAVALAGCSGGPLEGGSVGDQPEYSRWIAASDLPDSPSAGEPYGFVRTDFEALNDTRVGTPSSTATGTAQLGDAIADPGDDMVLAPVSASVGFLLAASFGLIGYGDAASGVLTAAIGSSESTDRETETATPHSTSAGMLSGNSIVFEGSFDAEAIADGLENFEQAGERGAFTIYEGVDGESFLDTSTLAFAVSSDAAVFALPASDGSGSGETPASGTPTGDRTGRDIVDERLAVAVGDAESAADADDDFDWVLRAGGNGAFVTAGYGRDSVAPNSGTEATTGGEGDAGTPAEEQFDVSAIETQVAAATTFANAVRFDRAAGEVSAEFAFVYDAEADVPTEAELDAFVESASDSDVVRDGRRVSVEGTWSDTNV